MFPGWQVWNDHKNRNKYFSKWYTKMPQHQAIVVIRYLRKNQNLTIVCQNLSGMTIFFFWP